MGRTVTTVIGERVVVVVGVGRLTGRLVVAGDQGTNLLVNHGCVVNHGLVTGFHRGVVVVVGTKCHQGSWC